MSNPTSVVTERRLGAFYQEILPYLGGSADAGFTPVGSVIAIMGVTAPANYLACNGQIVNVADYPELANYFQQQFGTKYKFGGSGTTFGIPDLRGEFLRGTGTNSHTGNGNGADVGEHQDATQMPEVSSIDLNSSNRSVQILADAGKENYMGYADTRISSTDTTNWLKASASYVNTGRKGALITTRPTNTSILWCIATKDIYLNPAMDYSTSEKVVGKWIDGSTLYQKTVTVPTPQCVTDGSEVRVDYEITSWNVEMGVDLNCFAKNPNSMSTVVFKGIWVSSQGYGFRCWTAHNDTTNKDYISITNSNRSFNEHILTITLQYTKTT